MRIRTLLLPSIAALAAAVLCLSTTGEAYVFLGGMLGLGQRDFRVCNNFTDPEANDNQVLDPNFPGATGAVMAIWKGCVEWGSELHGDGNGDPMQPGDLGSGGANFDPSFQGLAPAPGGTNDNIFSEISGFGGGLIAYCETPISDGWRIRFYQQPSIWIDGPDTPPLAGAGKDIQGITAHEYGHALGLDHSNVIGCTMQSGSAGDHYYQRTIEADDIAGVQALYGAASPTKPHIDGYDLGAGQVVVRGANFSPNGNEIWFTRGSGVGDGTPVKVRGLLSTTGGTRLTATIPSAAGPGDILVRTRGNTGASLSNAFPFDPTLGHCADPVLYGTPKITSTGGAATLSWQGTPSATYDDFQIIVQGGIQNTPAILFHGAAQASIPFMGGTLYSSAPHSRDLLFTMGMFGEGILPISLDSSMAGTTRYYQVWFADPGDSFGVGLSDALAVTLCP